MLPLSLRIGHDGEITVFLRNAKTATEMEDEVNLDVDHAGHWFQGIEVLGSVGFDLAKAVRPFNPKRPSQAGKVGATYDEEADAAYFYITMRPAPSQIHREYSHSISPSARFGLDEQGGFVWVTFSAKEANENPEEFLKFVGAPVETERGPKT